MLGPMLVLGAGLGPLFVLIFLVGLTKVRDDDAGVASGLVNVGQQVGGAIGLAVVGTVAWSAVAGSLRSQAAAAATAGVHASATAQTRMYDHALAAGFSNGYLLSAGILALAMIIALAVIPVSRHPCKPVTPTHRTWREARNPNGQTRLPRPSAWTRGLAAQCRGREQTEGPGAIYRLGPGMHA
jgi:hypothetical protein